MERRAWLPLHRMQFNQWSKKANPPLQTKKSGELLDKVFSLKELFNVPEFPATGSTRAKLPKLANSPLCDALLNEGAVFSGKVHTHEVALGLLGWNPIAGQGLNPHDSARISGGSSSGSAISVADKECDFSLGTDTGGSIRTPAAFCGIFGFKPTTGRISTEGVVELSKTLDHVGIMAREISLVRTVFNLLKDKESAAGTTERTKKKIGFWNVKGWLEPSTLREMNSFADKIRDAGWQVEHFTFALGAEVYPNISLKEASDYHKEALGEPNPKFGEMTLNLLRLGQVVTEEAYQKALAARLQIQKQVAKLFEEFDYLIGPTVPCIAPKVGTQTLVLPEAEVPLRQAVLRLTSPWSVAGVPVLNIPLPLDGLFVGVQLIGPHGQDEALLDFAEMKVCGGEFIRPKH